MLATGVKNVDKEITGLLNGIALSDLLASNIVLQKDLDRLAQMPKMERRHVINAMMGRECFSRVDDKVALEIRPLKKALESERDVLKQLQHRNEEYGKQIGEQENKQQVLTQLEQQLKQISQILAQTEKDYAGVKAYKDIQDKQEELKREIGFRNETRARIMKQLASASKLQSQQKRLKKRQKQLEYLEDDTTKFDELQEISNQLRTIVDEKQMVTEVITELEAQLDGLSPIDDVVVEYESVKTQREKAEARQQRIFSPFLYILSIGLLAAGIATLFFNLPIGIILMISAIPFLAYLGRTYYFFRRNVLKLDQLRQREETLSEVITQHRVKENFQDQLQEQLNRKEDLNKEIMAQSKKVHSQLNQLSPSVLEGIKISAESDASTLLETVRIVDQKLLELKAGADSITAQLGSIRDQIKGMAEAEEDLAQTKLEIVALNDELSSLSFPTLPENIGKYSNALFEKLDKQVREMRERKVELQTNRKTTAERIVELNNLLKENEGVAEEFSVKEREVAKLDENIKTGQLVIDLIREVAEKGREQVRPRVVNVMERLLATITDGRYRFPKLSEDYSLKVYSSTAGEYVEANLYSGGTEDQFLLALRLGFAIALLPQGRGTAPQFLLLDEPFGGSDIQRRDNIIRLLKDELSRTFQQIIVVSHQVAVLSASEHQYRMANGRIIHS